MRTQTGYQDERDDDDEGSLSFRRKSYKKEMDSDDSGDEGGYTNGPRVSNMADFLKFQRKKMPILQNHLLKHQRGNSVEQRDEDLGPKGFYMKRNANSYNSDTE